MTGRDRGLKSVGTERAAQSLRAIERSEAATDKQMVPARTILVEQEDRLAIWSDPGGGARGLNLKERNKAMHLGLARH